MATTLAEQARDEALPGRADRSTVSNVLLSFLLVFVVYLGSGVSDYGDGYLALPTAHSLLYDGDLDLSEFSDTEFFERHYALVQVGDRHVDYFPHLTAVLAAPALGAWDLLSQVGVTTNSEELIRSGRVRNVQILLASSITAAAAVVLASVTRQLLLTARRSRSADRDATRGPEPDGTDDADHAGGSAWLEPEHRWALPVFSLVIGLGTTLWSSASRALWQHGPSVLLCGLALLAALRLLTTTEARRRQVLAATAGALAGLSYWARPTNIVLCAVLVLVVALRRRGVLASMLAGMAGVQVLYVTANLVLLGRALPPYFSASRVGWHPELPEAVAANLVSPARGLFVFSPFLLAALLAFLPGRWRQYDPDQRAVIAACGLGSIGYLVAVSGYGEKWWAGHSFGPRFMTESLVLLAPIAVLVIFGPRPPGVRTRVSGRHFRLLGVVAIALSVLPHTGSAQIRGVRCWNREPTNIDEDPSRVWDLDRPLVFEGARLLLTGTAAEVGAEECSS